MGYRWVDQRYHIWIAPLGSLAVIWITGMIGYGIYMAAVEDFGENISKQITLLVLFSVLFAGGLNTCAGIYQLFFIELRHKFIARKVEHWRDEIQVRGYYFKELRFKGSDIAKIEEYVVKPRFWKKILTFLSYTRPNYKVSLKNGREFYLPGEMADVDELKMLLASEADNLLKNT